MHLVQYAAIQCVLMTDDSQVYCMLAELKINRW